MEQLHEQNLLEDEFWEIDEDSIKKGEKLGSGEFGTVYKALWHESDVAVKVLKQSDNLALGEFVTEMNMMRKLHHPHVVQFLGGCTKTKPYFIVTELSSGGSLQEYFASKTRLPLTRELELAIDCAKGMAYLHSEGIKKPMTLHRDLKPANVMIFGNVYAHGDKARKEVLLYSGTLKITDFGLSKTLSDTGNNAYRLTGETGSYRYMAPEVYRHEDYNHKVDVYAYGMILYHLFEGRAPFNLLDPMQAAVASSKKNMRPKFSLLTKNLSSHKKLQALIETCWAADPAQRPDFVEIIPRLKECMKDMKHEMHEVKKKKWHGLFSSK
jgi:serine/threonine protein kinase